MSHSGRLMFTIVSAVVLAITVFDGTASTQRAVSSDPIAPGPYRIHRGYRVDVTEHSGAESVGVDARGNVYGAVVRRRMLEKHEKR